MCTEWMVMLPWLLAIYNFRKDENVTFYKFGDNAVLLLGSSVLPRLGQTSI